MVQSWQNFKSTFDALPKNNSDIEQKQAKMIKNLSIQDLNELEKYISDKATHKGNMHQAKVKKNRKTMIHKLVAEKQKAKIAADAAKEELLYNLGIALHDINQFDYTKASYQDRLSHLQDQENNFANLARAEQVYKKAKQTHDQLKQLAADIPTEASVIDEFASYLENTKNLKAAYQQKLQKDRLAKQQQARFAQESAFQGLGSMMREAQFAYSDAQQARMIAAQNAKLQQQMRVKAQQEKKRLEQQSKKQRQDLDVYGLSELMETQEEKVKRIAQQEFASSIKKQLSSEASYPFLPSATQNRTKKQLENLSNLSKEELESIKKIVNSRFNYNKKHTSDKRYRGLHLQDRKESIKTALANYVNSFDQAKDESR
jgi:hypothetical protein